MNVENHRITHYKNVKKCKLLYKIHLSSIILGKISLLNQMNTLKN